MKEYKDYAKITAHFDLAIEEAIKFGGDVGKHAVLLFETMRNKLDAIPTADVAEVRHGRWGRTGTLVGLMNFKHFYRCTACGRRGGNTKTNYCPHCGCKMDKEDCNG